MDHPRFPLYQIHQMKLLNRLHQLLAIIFWITVAIVILRLCAWADKDMRGHEPEQYEAP